MNKIGDELTIKKGIFKGAKGRIIGIERSFQHVSTVEFPIKNGRIVLEKILPHLVVPYIVIENTLIVQNALKSEMYEFYEPAYTVELENNQKSTFLQSDFY